MRNFKLRFERWQAPLTSKRGVLEVGTIRTVPENYFVADVFADGSIKFDPKMEAMTRDIDQKKVGEWWEAQRVLLAVGHPLALPMPQTGHGGKVQTASLPRARLSR